MTGKYALFTRWGRIGQLGMLKIENNITESQARALYNKTVNAKKSPSKGYREAQAGVSNEDAGKDVDESLEEDDPDAIKCVICYDTEQGGRKHTRCGHKFHGKCIQDWLKANPFNKTCPLCRQNLWNHNINLPVNFFYRSANIFKFIILA